jgi:hypothetical protein
MPQDQDDEVTTDDLDELLVAKRFANMCASPQSLRSHTINIAYGMSTLWPCQCSGCNVHQAWRVCSSYCQSKKMATLDGNSIPVCSEHQIIVNCGLERSHNYEANYGQFQASSRSAWYGRLL